MRSENIKLFEKYFNQEMGEAEKKQFEVLLEDDSVLKKEFEEYKAIYDAISDKEVMELRKHLKKLGEKHHNGGLGGRIIGNGNRWLWLAAVLIVSLSIVGIVFLWMTSPMTPQFFGSNRTPEKLQQEVYDLEPAYEELIRYRVRSDDFQLFQPRDSLVVDRESEIRFEWTYAISRELILT